MIEILAAAFALSVQPDVGAMLAPPREAWQQCITSGATEAAAGTAAAAEVAEQALVRCAPEQGRYRAALMQLTSNRRQRQMVDDTIEEMRGMARESVVDLVTELRSMGAGRSQ
jgi:hypothetical protein